MDVVNPFLLLINLIRLLAIFLVIFVVTYVAVPLYKFLIKIKIKFIKSKNFVVLVKMDGLLMIIMETKKEGLHIKIVVDAFVQIIQ